ncbi:MAG: type II toxin-antitoxin system RelE/ParE family toxin [Gemmataceae bacterium]
MARSKRPVLLPAAKRDVKKAYEWYEEQKSGLGEMFLERVEECLKAIERSPNAFQLVANGAHRAIVKQFPYVIFYRIEAKAIHVYAVFHTSQNPQKWMDRLAD